MIAHAGRIKCTCVRPQCVSVFGLTEGRAGVCRSRAWAAGFTSPEAATRKQPQIERERERGKGDGEVERDREREKRGELVSEREGGRGERDGDDYICAATKKQQQRRATRRKQKKIAGKRQN